MLADHKWYLKERNIAFTQTWKLETFSRSYTPEAMFDREVHDQQIPQSKEPG